MSTKFILSSLVTAIVLFILNAIVYVLCTVDFGLLGSTHNFSTAGAFADLTCSTITITLSGGVAGWMLGRNSRNKYLTQRNI